MSSYGPLNTGNNLRLSEKLLTGLDLKSERTKANFLDDSQSRHCTLAFTCPQEVSAKNLEAPSGDQNLVFVISEIFMILGEAERRPVHLQVVSASHKHVCQIGSPIGFPSVSSPFAGLNLICRKRKVSSFLLSAFVRPPRDAECRKTCDKVASIHLGNCKVWMDNKRFPISGCPNYPI